MRQIILDTETTGLSPAEGHRIVEIGCIEMENRRLTGNTFHYYLNPERDIDRDAMAVHGITQEMLADKPCFRDIAKEFIEFVQGAELIIHNASFDTGFINHELKLAGGRETLAHYCAVLDTLEIARKRHPGQKNNLDALCKRYGIDNSGRDLHGALLDAQILADVYLAMTGGQVILFQETRNTGDTIASIQRIPAERPRLPVLFPTSEEAEAHAAKLAALDKACGGICLWRELESISE